MLDIESLNVEQTSTTMNGLNWLFILNTECLSSIFTNGICFQAEKFHIVHNFTASHKCKLRNVDNVVGRNSSSPLHELLNVLCNSFNVFAQFVNDGHCLAVHVISWPCLFFCSR
jgi:hypothetical protein